MAANANTVAVGQRRAGANPLSPDIDSVCGSKIGDDEAVAGIDHDGVVTTDGVIVDNDVVIGEASDPGCGLAQRITFSGAVAQVGDGLPWTTSVGRRRVTAVRLAVARAACFASRGSGEGSADADAAALGRGRCPNRRRARS